MILCTECGHPTSRVIDSRPTGRVVRRRRQCRKCGHVWITEESTVTATASLNSASGRVGAEGSRRG